MKYFILLLVLTNLNCLNRAAAFKLNDSKHSENGKVVKSIVESIENNSGEAAFRVVYTFDEKGNCVSEVKYKGEVDFETNLYSYSNGNLSAKFIGLYEHFDPDDSEVRCAYSERYQYNKDGQRIKSIVYDTSSVVNPIRKEYQYDTALNTLRIDRKDEDKNLLGYDFCKYDEYNLIRELLRFDVNGAMSKNVEYNYRKFGMLSEKIVSNEKEEVVEKYIYRYSREGKLAIEKRIQYSEQGLKKYKSEYQYNPFGNQVKETCWLNGELVQVKTRSIEYYE